MKCCTCVNWSNRTTGPVNSQSKISLLANRSVHFHSYVFDCETRIVFSSVFGDAEKGGRDSLIRTQTTVTLVRMPLDAQRIENDPSEVVWVSQPLWGEECEYRNNSVQYIKNSHVEVPRL